MPEKVIAVDPGRKKCGVAVVGRNSRIIIKAVIPAAELVARVQELVHSQKISIVVLGNRTGSQAAKKVLQDIKAGGEQLTVIAVDEHRSTDEARRRYWQDNPPRGFWRLFPTTMQVPPCPVDDYVAVILAERYFAANGV